MVARNMRRVFHALSDKNGTLNYSQCHEVAMSN
jgi:hypothetical protein